jgi:pyruvate dehydrogenase E1 component beta subunit
MPSISYREALRRALREELARDDRVLIIGAEVGYFGGAFKTSEGLLAEFGERRVRDMPNSPLTIVGAGIGAALAGLKPVVEIIAPDASLLAIESMLEAGLNSVSSAAPEMSIVIRVVILRGEKLRAQTYQRIASSLLKSCDVRVAAPMTPSEAYGLLKSAIRDDDPVIFIEQERMYGNKGEVPDDEDFTIPLGVADIKRAGGDLTIVSPSGQGTHILARLPCE